MVTFLVPTALSPGTMSSRRSIIRNGKRWGSSSMMSCTESGPMSCVTAVSLFILFPASCLQLPIPQRAEPEELPRRPCRTDEHRNPGRHVAHDPGRGAALGAGPATREVGRAAGGEGGGQ